jgi:predicted Rossmann fold flavoprotein
VALAAGSGFEADLRPRQYAFNPRPYNAVMPTDPPDYDAVILGAGAAGLFAATFAAERGRRVLLLEKGKKAGVKILMSGGTRCNVTHDCDNRGIIDAFGANGKFLHSALANFSPRDTVEFFRVEGVPTKVESTGKVFPVSDKALDVLQALLRRLHRSGATLALQEPATDIDAVEGGFRVSTPLRSVTATHVLVTTGGLSYPGCGTTGDGYGFARKFGHTVTKTRPSLVPVTVNADWVKDLSGVTMHDVGVKVLPPAGKPLASRRGSLLFAHFGLSGPVAMDVSRAISGHATPTELSLEFDLLPGVGEQPFGDFLQAESLSQGKKQLAGVLAERLPRRVCDHLLTLTGQAVDRRAAALSKADRLALVAAVKRLRVPVKGTLGYEKAEVTSGGVALDEVDSRTMQSKRVPGLYFAGEVLDLDGWIGGYNFQSAWSTGALAAKSL